MKKITLLALLSLTALGIQAQNDYTLSASQGTYTNLQNGTSINNNQVWDWDGFPVITLPFNFSVAGEPVNRFLFDDDYFAFITPNGDFDSDTGVYYFYPSSAYIQDRTYSTGVSSSPISYKTEGETGNRIFKVEIKNAGLENAQSLGFSEDHFYMNCQIWFYEADNAIEFRYGSHNITDVSYVSDEDEGLLAGFSHEDDKVYFIYGQSTNPTYNEFSEDNFPEDPISLDAFPANGTIYRLTPTEVAGLDGFTMASFKLFPNPATHILHLQSESVTATEYSICNIEGKIVAQNKIINTGDIQINIENLEQGLYFVKIGSQYLKFIKQ